ncbi:hypothetical protein [Rhodopila sp.]|uniref:hypothetical protein n=1 Tax=Rhodopila sp. TaxID=2480087 RepID=UPI003D0C9A99
MKLVYFPQTLRKVPLGYDFRIYTYGPYDGQVLEDLKVAELKGAVRSSEVGYSIGTGYAIVPGHEIDALLARSPAIQRYQADIISVISEFGNRSATDLEMASTLVFLDRTESLAGRQATVPDTARKVKEIKPRLDVDRILREAATLKEKGYIAAV